MPAEFKPQSLLRRLQSRHWMLRKKVPDDVGGIDLAVGAADDPLRIGRVSARPCVSAACNGVQHHVSVVGAAWIRTPADAGSHLSLNLVAFAVITVRDARCPILNAWEWCRRDRRGATLIGDHRVGSSMKGDRGHRPALAAFSNG